MIETKRADKKKNIDKVTASLVKDPLQTEREIANNLWISRSTAHIMKKEIEQSQAKDERIISLTDEDFALMQDIQSEKKRRLREEKEQINNNDIDKWENTATKRYTLFRWDATDENWALKEVIIEM